MKIHRQTSKVITRLSITKKGCNTERIDICEASTEEVIKKVTDLINQQSTPNILPTPKTLTRIDFRAYVGGKAGKSESISFYYIDPGKVLKLIEAELS